MSKKKKKKFVVLDILKSYFKQSEKAAWSTFILQDSSNKTQRMFMSEFAPSYRYSCTFLYLQSYTYLFPHVAQNGTDRSDLSYVTWGLLWTLLLDFWNSHPFDLGPWLYPLQWISVPCVSAGVLRLRNTARIAMKSHLPRLDLNALDTVMHITGLLFWGRKRVYFYFKLETSPPVCRTHF